MDSQPRTALADAIALGFHGAIAGSVATVDPSLIRYAQICDASPDMTVPRDTPALIREARTGRLLPGEGVLPLAELVATLPKGAPLAIEAPCAATAHLPALERAKRAHHALSTLLQGEKA